MIDENLDVYPHKKVHIEIDPNAKPVHSMPHPVPQIHLKTLKKEDNRVRWISNSRQLNKVIRRKADNHGHFVKVFWVQVFC
jgi:hypothetical protein